MNNLVKQKYNIIVLFALLASTFASAQERYKESFKVNKDALVSVNAEYTNVIFETWNKDEVEVEAFVEGDLSNKEKQEIFDDWSFDVLGNSKKVLVTSNASSYWGGMESLSSFPNAFEGLEGLGAITGLEALKGLESLSILGELGDMNWDVIVPDLPDNLDKMPRWPFNGYRPNLKNGDEYNYYVEKNKKNYTFDLGEYKQNKQRYVDKLNKKYGTDVSVREVDTWLDEVDKWSEELEKVMEDWGENFGEQFEQKFGPEFEQKMEKWGEEFGKSMEKWGEEFGEKFGAEMEKWGEEFGKDMEKWAEQFEKDAEKWAEQFDDEDGEYSKEVITDKNGNKSVIIKSNRKGGLFEDESNSRAKKTIIIRMPKGTKTDINVRHGEVKMADLYNVKATLEYTRFAANSIDGGDTRINASYAPVYVNHWQDGVLNLRYVDDCKINKVDKINLQANSSDVNVNVLEEEGLLMGSFGSLFVNNIGDGFRSLDIILENTDATLSMPSAAFDFYYSGKKSRFKCPMSIKLTTENQDKYRSLLKGVHRSTNSGKSITINASYSNVSFQSN